ncbi:MAG: hydrogenase maturation protease [Gammaproteobacteria bacterium]|nr:hydrogenase maturation protease [Gammaproteobacteria bacterium]
MKPDLTLNEMRILILAVGNRSRGDDGVAPIMLDRVANKINGLANVEFVIEEVYQLQPEHIYDIDMADAVLIVDAATDLDANIRLSPIHASKNVEVGIHTVSPVNLLGLYQNLFKKAPPPTLLLSIKACEFGFTEKLSRTCQDSLAEAELVALDKLANPHSFFNHSGSSRAMQGRR